MMLGGFSGENYTPPIGVRVLEPHTNNDLRGPTIKALKKELVKRIHESDFYGTEKKLKVKKLKGVDRLDKDIFRRTIEGIKEDRFGRKGADKHCRVYSNGDVVYQYGSGLWEKLGNIVDQLL